MADVSDRPEPNDAATPAEFVEAMRRLKRWTGFGFRQLEKRATEGGHVLPRSTLTVALTRDSVPREDLVAAFAHACGCDDDQTARWVAARRRVAAAGTANVPAPEQPLLAPPPVARRRVRRLVSALVALALAVTAGMFLLNREPTQGTDRAAPSRPDPSQTRTSRQTPKSTQPSTAASTTETAAGPGGVVPAALDAPVTSEPPAPPPASPPPTHGTKPGPPPEASGRKTIPIEGEAPIHCPVPYLNTPYADLAQCTQVSGDKARVGYYSPYTQEFGPTIDWMDVTEYRWFEGTMLADDGVEAEVRGYAVVNTTYGAGVFATQYRDGQARWGTVNLVTNRFYPASQGWYDVGSS